MEKCPGDELDPNGRLLSLSACETAASCVRSVGFLGNSAGSDKESCGLVGFGVGTQIQCERERERESC